MPKYKSENEASLQRKCQKLLRDGGAFLFKTHGDMYMRPGIPDLIVCMPTDIEIVMKMLKDGMFKNNKVGIFIGIETKAPCEEAIPDPAQKIVGAEIRNAGGIWFTTNNALTVEAIVEKFRGNI